MTSSSHKSEAAVFTWSPCSQAEWPPTAPVTPGSRSVSPDTSLHITQSEYSFLPCPCTNNSQMIIIAKYLSKYIYSNSKISNIYTGPICEKNSNNDTKVLTSHMHNKVTLMNKMIWILPPLCHQQLSWTQRKSKHSCW